MGAMTKPFDLGIATTDNRRHQNRPMAKLVVLSEGLTGKSYELKVDKTTIGRMEDNSFQISEPSVSSHHCEVLLRGKDVVVKDLNSTNGTFINGEKVAESPLKPGQILRLGQVEMRLETGEGLPSSKKRLDQTRVIEGVKLGDFEQGGGKPIFDKNSPFAKKSNKTAVIFITIGIVLAVIILVFLFIAYQRLQP
jgi:pSer/pThr/pTyr-binding forkhead associated (FHA) protein